MSDQMDSIQFTDSLIDVVAGNPGLTISAADFSSVARGDTVLTGGCIRYMRYGSSAEDLDQVAFDNGFVLTEAEAANLKDFRENFECAAKFGMGATFCWNRRDRKIFMVNLYPCLCTCEPEKGRGHGRPATDFLGLSKH